MGDGEGEGEGGCDGEGKEGVNTGDGDAGRCTRKETAETGASPGRLTSLGKNKQKEKKVYKRKKSKNYNK